MLAAQEKLVFDQAAGTNEFGFRESRRWNQDPRCDLRLHPDATGRLLDGAGNFEFDLADCEGLTDRSVELNQETWVYQRPRYCVFFMKGSEAFRGLRCHRAIKWEVAAHCLDVDEPAAARCSGHRHGPEARDAGRFDLAARFKLEQAFDTLAFDRRAAFETNVGAKQLLRL